MDQLTKQIVSSSVDLGRSLELAPVLSFTPSRTTGVSFSLLQLQGDAQRWPLVDPAVFATGALAIWLYRTSPGRILGMAGLALAIGGAIGNLIDRALHGDVFDFIHLHLGTWSFAVFNVADAAITCGVVLLLLDSFSGARGTRRLPQAGT